MIRLSKSLSAACLMCIPSFASSAFAADPVTAAPGTTGPVAPSPVVAPPAAPAPAAASPVAPAPGAPASAAPAPGASADASFSLGGAGVSANVDAGTGDGFWERYRPLPLALELGV